MPARFIARSIVAITVLLIAVTSCLAQTVGEISGYVALESRVFFQDPQFPEQRHESGLVDVVLEPEWYYESAALKGAFTVRPFFRGDSDDVERTHFDLRQCDYLHVGDGWEVRAGIGKVFWGVAESEHLVDIVNQTDAIEDVDREDKLGQPMVQLTVPSSIGTFDAFALPGFRVRTFPGRHGRVRSQFVVDQNDPDIEASLGRANIDFAARWNHTLGDWQVALSHFYGTGRDPRFRAKLPTTLPSTPQELLSETQLTPIYDTIHQTGLELQYTGDALLLKLEAIGRQGQGSYRAAAVGGFEYTFYDVAASGIDVGTLGEFLYDSFQPDDLPRSSDLPAGVPVAVVADALRRIETKSPPTPFEHDLFFGVRLGFNDTQSTHLLAGVIVDVTDASRFWSIEASRRLGDRFSVSADLRLFDGLAAGSYYHSVIRDDFAQVRVSYYL